MIRRSPLLYLLALLVLTAQCMGAEFLVMKVNNWMVDADKTGWTAEQIAEADRQYKIGDIVQVYPDGGIPENPCPNSPFFVLRVTGLSYSSATIFQEQLNEDYQVVVGTVTETRSRMKNRRKYGVTYDTLPKNIKNHIANNQYYNTTWTAIRGRVKNKITGLTQ